MKNLLTVIIPTFSAAEYTQRLKPNLAFEQGECAEFIWLSPKENADRFCAGDNVVFVSDIVTAVNNAVKKVETPFFMIMLDCFLPQRELFELVSSSLDEECFTAVNVSRYHKKAAFVPLYPKKTKTSEQMLNICGCVYCVLFNTKKFLQGGIRFNSFDLCEQYRVILKYRSLCKKEKLRADLFLFVKDLPLESIGEPSQEVKPYVENIKVALKNEHKGKVYASFAVRLYHFVYNFLIKIYGPTVGEAKRKAERKRKEENYISYEAYITDKGAEHERI